MRRIYSQPPSHYVYTTCQDASIRVKSFLRLKKLGLAEKGYPEVRRISIWLDDHLWKPLGYTSIKIATLRDEQHWSLSRTNSTGDTLTVGEGL